MTPADSVDVYLKNAGRRGDSWVPGKVVRVNAKRLVVEVEHVYLEPTDKRDIFGKLVRGVMKSTRAPKQITVRPDRVRKAA